jgi:hypothetical protein
MKSSDLHVLNRSVPLLLIETFFEFFPTNFHRRVEPLVAQIGVRTVAHPRLQIQRRFIKSIIVVEHGGMPLGVETATLSIINAE